MTVLTYSISAMSFGAWWANKKTDNKQTRLQTDEEQTVEVESLVKIKDGRKGSAHLSSEHLLMMSKPFAPYNTKE